MNQNTKLWGLLVSSLLFGIFSFAKESYFFPARELDWKQQYIQELKKDLCQDHHYFTECYQLSKKSCEQSLDEEFRKCHSQVRLPAQVESMSQSIHAAAHYGSCIGNSMDQKLYGKKAKTLKCTRRSQW